MTKMHNKTEVGRAINLLRNLARDWGIHSARGNKEQARKAHRECMEADRALRELLRQPAYHKPPTNEPTS